MIQILANISMIFSCLIILTTLYVLNLILPKNNRNEKLIFKSSKIWRAIYLDNVKLSVFVLILALFLLSILWLLYGKDLKASDIGQGVFIETFGMVFDVILLVLLFNFISSKGEKENAIRKYNEEIEDFREWKSEEAKYRIRGNIIRLNRLNYNKFDLAFIDLSNLKLLDCKFSFSNLVNTDFSNTNLNKAEFVEILCSDSKFNSCFLHLSDFSKATLQNTEFKKAFMLGSNFSHSTLSSINFAEADLRSVKFDKAYLYDPNFDGAKVSEDFIARLRESDITGHPVYDMYFIQKVPVFGYQGHYEFYAKKRPDYDEYLKRGIKKLKNAEG